MDWSQIFNRLRLLNCASEKTRSEDPQSARRFCLECPVILYRYLCHDSLPPSISLLNEVQFPPSSDLGNFNEDRLAGQDQKMTNVTLETSVVVPGQSTTINQQLTPQTNQLITLWNRNANVSANAFISWMAVVEYTTNYEVDFDQIDNDEEIDEILKIRPALEAMYRRLLLRVAAFESRILPVSACVQTKFSLASRDEDLIRACLERKAADEKEKVMMRMPIEAMESEVKNEIWFRLVFPLSIRSGHHFNILLYDRKSKSVGKDQDNVYQLESGWVDSLAKMAGREGVLVYHHSITEMFSAYVGETERRLRSLFTTLVKYSKHEKGRPSILVLEGIELIGRLSTREDQVGRESLKTTLLLCLDGVDAGEVRMPGVIGVSAVDPTQLDERLTRPGRFDTWQAVEFVKSF